MADWSSAMPLTAPYLTPPPFLIRTEADENEAGGMSCCADYHRVFKFPSNLSSRFELRFLSAKTPTAGCLKRGKNGFTIDVINTQ